MEQLVLREQRGAVLQIALNRPEQMNALNSALVTALADAVTDARRDDSVAVIHLTGTGRGFCAGADLIEASTATRSADGFRRWVGQWHRTFATFEACPKPVIALLNGLTLAGGLELALACDYMVAARSAKLGDLHANFGLVPGGGGSQRLPDAVGSRFARWLMFTGEMLTAHRALEIGLVQQVIDDDIFAEACWNTGEKMAARSRPGLAFMKRMSRPVLREQALALEIEAAANLVVAEDAREGLSAFAAKRPPRFSALADDDF